MKIQIEESALDSLKAMVQQLQDERDMLFGVVQYSVDNPEFDSMEFDAMARAAIAACTETKQVLAGK